MGLDLAAPLPTTPELKAVISDMPVDQIRAVATMVRVTLSVCKWNAAVRGSQVNVPLVAMGM